MVSATLTTKFNKMDNTEKARELINKHLYLHGGDGLGITNGDVYRAVLDAVSEALTIPVVSTRIFRRGDKVEWRGMKLIVVEVGVDEVLIATSENVDDEDYNDWWVRNEYVC